MISIIIPVYNVSQYLDECLKSVSAQTYTDWECILIDDGSTDNSGDICDRWCVKDPRFRVIHQANAGVSAARNKGIDLAQGDYITFIDSDDWVDDDYLDLLHASLHTSHADLCIVGLEQHKANGNVIQFSPMENISFRIAEESSDSFVDLAKKYLLFGPVSKLYSKRILSKNNIRFNKTISYGEDLVFNFQYLEKVNTISCNKSTPYHYRIYVDSSLSKKIRVNQFVIDYQQWQIVSDFFKSRNFISDNAKEYLYSRLWGIIYDGIFLLPKLPHSNNNYLKEILSIPEITNLQSYRHTFSCSSWIKYAIIWRLVFVFKIYFSIRQ